MERVTVGIRELRQNLSAYVRRVRAGEHIVVTERNEPVARLVPLIENEDPVERLIAEGIVKPSNGQDLLEIVPIFDEEESAEFRKVLEEQREDREFF